MKHKIFAAAALLLVLGGACSDGEGAASSTTAVAGSSDEVVFASGSLPETLPDTFPLPVGSSVGSTMVVSATGFTEVIVRISAEQGITTQFFEQGLRQAGFEVDNSAAVAEGWTIEFNLDGTKGAIDITEPVEGISQAVVRYNLP